MGMQTAGLRSRALCALSAVGMLALGTLVFVPSAYASDTVPRGPTGVVATPGNGSVIVRWRAPANDGGSAITGYVVRSSPGSKACKTTGAKACTIHGLKNGTTYTVGVRAHNQDGLGLASAHVRVQPGVPLTPKDVGATAGNAQATVTWAAPVTNGSAIRSYTVKSIPGSKTCTNHITTCTMTGLTNGTSYRFTVTATNARGTGASALSTLVTPHLPATLTITASDGSQTFGGLVPTITAVYSGFVDGDTPADLTTLPTCVSGTTSSSPVLGSYTSSCSGAVDPDYTIRYVDGTTTVVPATLTITASDGSQTFGGLVPTITAVYSGFVDGDTPADLTTLPTCVSGTTSSSPVLGSYTSSCSGAVDPDYTIRYVDGTTTVVPATLTITASDGSQTFGGLVPTITAVYSGFVDGDTPADLTTLPTCVSGTTSSSPVLGSYTSSCSGAVDPDYTIRYVDGTTTVVPATLTITASDGSQTFGGLVPTITAVYSGFVDGDTPADLTTLPTCVSGTTSSSPVLGSYTSSCSGAVDPDYTIRYVDGTTTVVPATLTITASDGSQTFGGLVPTITAVYSGFVDGDTPADLTTLPTCVSGTTSSSPVLGSYTSSCSGAVDPDYTIRYVDGTTTVVPATLTITASDGSQTFGGLVPTITAVYSGFVDGDTPADLTTLPTCVSGTTSSSPVLGSYTSSCSGAVDPDYTIRYVDGTTTVVPATLTITANPEVKLVGAPDPALTFVVVGLFGTDTTTGSLTRAPGNTPGVYAIDQGTLTAGPNYTIVYVGSFLTVLI